MDHSSKSNHLSVLINRLGLLRRSYIKNEFAQGILLVISFALGLGLLGLWLNTIFVFPVAARVAFLGISALILVISLSYFCLRPVFHPLTLEEVALKVEVKFPQLNNRLIAALQLSKNLEENPEGYSTEMIEAVIQQADLLSAGLSLKKIIQRSLIKRMGKITTGLASFWLIFALIFPGAFINSFYVFSHPLTEFVAPQKFFFVISPGDEEVVKYSDVKIRINVEGEKPKQVNFFWRNEGASWNKERLSRKTFKDKLRSQSMSAVESDFSYQFKEVKRSFEYYVEAEGVESDLYKITVVDKPRVVGLKLTFIYPHYTRLKTQVVDENDGNITAIAGTKVKIEAKANKRLEKAEIVFSDSSRKQAKIQGNLAVGEIVVRKDDSYFIQLWDESGNKNANPIEYKITKIEDQHPVVEILEPGRDQDLTESMRTGLLFGISDDYGFSSLKIVYQIISEGNESEEKTLNIDIPNNNQTQMNVEHVWNLSYLPLIPGDLVRYRAVVYDNDSFSGPKKAESKTYHLRLPSLDEIIAEVEREQQGQIVDLESVLRGQKELKRRLEDLSQEMNRFTGLDMNWQKRQQLEDALSKQRDLARKLTDLAQRMDENIKKIEENKLVALEMVEKMMEIKKLLEKIATPEMKEAMRQLAEALKNMDPDQLKAALEKMKISSEEMLKRLDRTIALLKRLQAEQKLGHLIKMAEELAERQNQVNQDVEASPEKDLLKHAQEEDKLKNDFNEFAQGIKEFTDLASELSLLPQQELQELSSMPEESGVRKDMNKMISKLSDLNKSGALKSGKSCFRKLQQMAQRLKDLQQQMLAGEKEEIVRAIKKSLYDVFSLSDHQERLFEQVNQLGRKDMALRDLAHHQQNLKSAGTRISEDLEALSHMTIYIDPDLLRFMALSLASMEEATRNLDERKKEIAIDEQRESIYDLNVTARKLMQAMGNAEKSCSGSGTEQLFQKMQGMCNKQSGINQQTQKLGQCGGPGIQLSLSQQAALQRLAAEQEAVRKTLSELENEFGNRSEILGRLDQLGEEMKKVVDDLKRMQVDRSTIDRQKKILSRLLDAEKSLRERDFSRQRRAEVGEDVIRKSPEQLPLRTIQEEQKAEEDLFKFMQETYPKEYEQLIKDYFKALSEERMKR